MYGNIEHLLGRPIAFHRSFLALTRDPAAAIMLSQAWYWTLNKEAQKREGWFYKSAVEWTSETGLTRDQQRRARSILRSTGMWKEELLGVPATLHFKIDKDEFWRLLSYV